MYIAKSFTVSASVKSIYNKWRKLRVGSKFYRSLKDEQLKEIYDEAMASKKK